MNSNWLSLLFFVSVCLGAAAVGSVSTASSVNTWYAQLRKPWFNPPNWIFGPVWSALYLTMAVSAWLVWKSGGWSGAKAALVLFFVQLALNVAWSSLFFGRRSPGAALIDIFLLLVAIVATIVAFSPFSRAAFWLMLPYAAWVAFAGLLNFELWRLNREPA